ncbi:DNA-binding transcriptional LysR family regulator [Pseudoclavibacter chungangensis]|uniref:LysR substrate-binding domain-containing protein n=1 Tax=Pseudoclavibacter chungangensis TaxID=587635 RepID=UPI00181995B3|nr:LysR substrate-binding domain-containing protein [Pseudoclavibacter chungangensis]NYJ66111.1 DNA-binding transcriptional LysR family regulator [Pseudoclavibacter chungangensis]
MGRPRSDTTPLQREWAAAEPEVELRFVRWNSPTAGLAEGRCDVAVVRRPLDDDRFRSVVVGLERRVVAFAADDPQWRTRRSLRMAEVSTRPVLVDPIAGTTVPELWPENSRPARTVETGDAEEWLDTIAVGSAVGTSSEATAVHNPRPDVLYRPLADGPPITVRLVWWRDDPPPMLARLVERVADRYR